MSALPRVLALHIPYYLTRKIMCKLIGKLLISDHLYVNSYSKYDFKNKELIGNRPRYKTKQHFERTYIQRGSPSSSV